MIPLLLLKSKTMSNETTKTQSVINRSAVKSFCLKVSKERRAGKFERVSEEFLQAIESAVEAEIRQVAKWCENSVESGDQWFITGAATKKIEEKLNERVRQIIQAKVQSHPSIGCTLK